MYQAQNVTVNVVYLVYYSILYIFSIYSIFLCATKASAQEDGPGCSEVESSMVLSISYQYVVLSIIYQYFVSSISSQYVVLSISYQYVVLSISSQYVVLSISYQYVSVCRKKSGLAAFRLQLFLRD